jgi:hypothetical protein
MIGTLQMWMRVNAKVQNSVAYREPSMSWGRRRRIGRHASN